MNDASRPSLRANGSRECAPDDRLREAIVRVRRFLDCFVAEFIIERRFAPTRWRLALTKGQIEQKD
jgi:hypothetical protein